MMTSIIALFDAVDLLKCKTPVFIPPSLWPPNSPDLNAHVWLQKAVISNSHCRNTVEHPTECVMLYVIDNF